MIATAAKVEIRFEDGWLCAYEDTRKVGGVKVTEDGGIVHLSHLYMEQDAPPEALLSLFRAILRRYKGMTIRAVVQGVPGYERLLKTYQRMGMDPYGICMEKHN